MLIKVLLLVLFIAYSGGVFYSGVTWQTKKGSTSDLINPVFSNQNAKIHGDFISVEDREAKVKNVQSGAESAFRLSDKFQVLQLDNRLKMTDAPYPELKDTDLNKKAIITLEVVNGKYEITSAEFITQK